MVWGEAIDPVHQAVDSSKLRYISSVLRGLVPLNTRWRELVSFTASYYQRSLGEVALAALPPTLRDLSPEQLSRRLNRSSKTKEKSTLGETLTTPSLPELTPDQARTLAELAAQPGPFLLFGATGSGKTEVYLRCVQETLTSDPSAQALVMVPEINLTPQLEERFLARFAPIFGDEAVVSLHSGMTNPQRLKNWLSAHQGKARIVLGTRMAVFASMPGLRIIVVDEEHDPSYKQQEGARYSARDLAVYRGRMESAKVLLGSATPSLESWHHSRPPEEGGRYVRLTMAHRVGTQTQGPMPVQNHGLPLVRRVDMNHQPRGAVISPPLLEAIKTRVARGEQCMIFLNRRGYAPVLSCTSCDWKSQCLHCSAFRVFHKLDRTLRCHHCGYTERVPRACPDCGNVDINPLGRGTEQLEEHLAELLAEVRRPGTVSDDLPQGQGLRIARIDADSTRLKGALESQLAEVHSGEVDVLVGTQMIAKGHDFRRITLVAAINPDGALFSSDFRAPERLFSLLMQAAGRAGRDASLGSRSEMWIQTSQPAHPLFAALKQHDYPAFAADQLAERAAAQLPPFSFQALIRADARTQEVAQGFLNAASKTAGDHLHVLSGFSQITRYPAVPMTIQRIADVERAQLLVESPSRTALQRFLAAWQGLLQDLRALPEHKGLIRWAIDVDPFNI
jgi:primosomal protein N' (replication factor Y)